MGSAIKCVFILLSSYLVSTHGFLNSEVLQFLSNLGLPNFAIIPRSISTITTTTENFTYTEWSNFTSCDKVCGGGHSSRSRRCLNQQGKQVEVVNCAGRQNYPTSFTDILRTFVKSQLVEVETISCNLDTCETTAWSDWSTCSRPCGGGVQTSKRSCLNTPDSSMCNFQNIRSRRCGTKSCFRMTDWNDWGKCSRDCGGGRQSRTRSCVPNFEQNDPSYNTVASIIGVFSHYQFINNLASGSFGGIGSYLWEYSNICWSGTSQQQICNSQACPKCPYNQVYHHCKPCVQRCQILTARSNIFRLPSTSDLLRYSQSCGGSCIPGCGCPLSSPYLGSDQRCYLLQAWCPINRANQVVESRLVAIAGNNAQTNSAIPTPTSAVSNKSVEETTASEMTDASLPTCEYDVLIARTPGQDTCVCVGTFTILNCQTNDDALCPGLCQQDPAEI